MTDIDALEYIVRPEPHLDGSSPVLVSGEKPDQNSKGGNAYMIC